MHFEQRVSSWAQKYGKMDGYTRPGNNACSVAVARGLEKFILVVASLVSRLDMANYTCTCFADIISGPSS